LKLPWTFALWLALGWGGAVTAGPFDLALARQDWVETRTTHFNIYSYERPEDVYWLATCLEQYCAAYAQLAGAQAVSSPPIIVLAFPDEAAMKPFLPLYHGQPDNLAGFFKHGNDENLIVLALPDPRAPGDRMQVIFHEYTHLLFRRNDAIWPLWLKEGMAEVYSTFVTDGQAVEIARPIEHHLRLLQTQPLMPLAELFAVGHDSLQYNERDRQGIFYAESWLLTDYLMAGDNAVLKARFGKFTELLRAGQPPVAAFTNALQTPLPVVERWLQDYLERGEFAPIAISLPADVASTTAMAARRLTPVEAGFRLGDELLRIDRLDAAESCFRQLQALAPASPLPYEGLGLLAVQQHDTTNALANLHRALRLGSTSYLANYLCALEEYRVANGESGRFVPVLGQTAAAIHGELLRALTLMPSFGPAHELFGIFELVQGENFGVAEQHLQIAVQLEPEQSAYLLALAQAQFRNQKPDAAMQTLQPLLAPGVDAELREQAVEMLRELKAARP
jgi:tetratricopeptide (TPR) repeat protein